MNVQELIRRYRLQRAAEAVMRSIPFMSDEWRIHVSVVSFSKEYAQQALEHAETLRGSGESKKFVKGFLLSLTKFLPSEESYKEAARKRKKEGSTSKQENRKKKLNKENGREEGKKKARR